MNSLIEKSFCVTADRPSPAVNLALFGRWTLRDEVAKRRLALRSARDWPCSRHRIALSGLLG